MLICSTVSKVQPVVVLGYRCLDRWRSSAASGHFLAHAARLLPSGVVRTWRRGELEGSMERMQAAVRRGEAVSRFSVHQVGDTIMPRE